MFKRIAFAALAATLAAALRPAPAAAQKALVYCPVAIDGTGCGRIADAIGSRFPDGVDRGYDGSNGTLDLHKVDLQHYAVVVVPSLADNDNSKPYALLRDVAPRFKMAINGRVAIYAGAPDQGGTNRDAKNSLITNLASWASGGHKYKTGLVGLVAFLDLSSDATTRYDWVRAMSPADVSADADLQTFGSVDATSDASPLLSNGGSALKYGNMASLGLHIGKQGAVHSKEAASAGTAMNRKAVLVKYSLTPDASTEGASFSKAKVGGASFSTSSADASTATTSGPTLTTNKPDYFPGDTVTFTGSGFAPGDTVTITIHEDPTYSYPDRQLTSVADGSGSFVNRDMLIVQQDLGASFVATVVGSPSGIVATTTFTDGIQTVALATADNAAPANVTWQANWTSYSNSSNCSGNGTANTTLLTGSSLNSGNNSYPSANQNQSELITGAAATGTFSGQYAFAYWSTSASSTTPVTMACVGGAQGGQTSIAQNLYAHFKLVAQATTTVVSSTQNPSSYGQSVTFTATISVSSGPVPTGSVQFKIDGTAFGSPAALSGASSTSSSANSAATTTLSAGNHVVTADYIADAGFTTSSGTLSGGQQVGKATPDITWSNPADITYGTALDNTQLNATAAVPGTFVYTPASGTKLNAGDAQTLKVDFTPTDGSNYNSASKTVTINVLKATPVITWANPADITYGTALDATQLNATASVAGTFTYTPATGTKLNAGASQTLSVSFTATDASNYNTTSKTVSINVLKATPVITWANPADIVFGTLLGATQLNATANVAGSFTYTPAAGTKLGAGNAQSLKADFTPADAANYTSATKTVSINVLKGTPVITWANPSDITYGTLLGASQLNASADVAGSFVYTPAAGAKLNAGSGQSLKADFTPTDAANYNTATKTVTINVLKATPVVTWSNPADITYGTGLDGTQLNATADVAGNFVYTPATGTKLNAGANQTLSVNFTPTDASNYNGATKAVSINVLKATPVVTWANPADIVYGTALSAAQLNAIADVAGTFLYTPASGTKLNAGNAQALKVDFTPTDASNYNGASKTVTINVLKATPVITWSNPADITYGTTLGTTQLNATVDAEGTLTYTPAAGTKLNAGQNQSLSVNFAPNDAVNYNSVSKTVSINVLKANPVISWSNPADIVYGTLLSATQLNATADVTGSFTYTPASGTQLNAGNAQSLKADFTPSDAGNYNAVSKTVSINVLKATPVITWNNPSDIVYGTGLDGTQLNATANVSGAFSYAPAAGTKLNAGPNQSLSVIFTPADGNNYNSATKSVSINVMRATPTVSWSSPADIVYGTVLSATQLNATASVTGTFTYSPAAGTLLNAGLAQTLSVGFTPADVQNYNSVPNTTVKINVLKATPTLTWANPTDLVYGTVLSASQLNATASVPGGFTYTPAAGTKLNAGPGQVLKVDFTPTDASNYNGASKTVTINVLKATPVITWSNPADIVYGTVLSNAQLNASANVAGTFAYTPPAGTTLSAGPSQTLSVSFTPGDGANYNNATGSVYINVQKAPATVVLSNLVQAYRSGSVLTPSYTTTPSGVQVTLSFLQNGATATPSAVGVYNVNAKITDPNYIGPDDNELFVIYDASGGFVTGGGWINSPLGACQQTTICNDAVGKANFGFVSKYEKGATIPTGSTEFQFQAGNLNFKSTSYQWLTVSGARAQYKGTGTINGTGSYDFILTAVDGSLLGGSSPDQFRIKIMSNGVTVYDNQLGNLSDTSPLSGPSTQLGGGSISIKSK